MNDSCSFTKCRSSYAFLKIIMRVDLPSSVVAGSRSIAIDTFMRHWVPILMISSWIASTLAGRSDAGVATLGI